MKKRVLFIDRDGTLIKEPPVDFQVDSLEKLEFVAGVFRNLYFIRKKIDFEFVIVTNQDGLGTDSFPEEKFWPVQNKMLQAFANEGIVFDAIYIDKSFPEENVPTRKPGTAMLTSYFTNDYDLSESYVIGDRLTDIQLAENLGAKAIFMGSEDELKKIRDRQLIETCVCVAADWDTIYSFLASRERKAVL